MSFKKLNKDIYLNHLSPEDRFRYHQKLTVEVNGNICSIPDPFAEVEEVDWSVDPVCWPNIEMAHIISYFIKKPGLYTLMQLENYKSLQGYDFAISGKVGVIAAKKIPKSGGLIYLRTEVAHSQSLSTPPLNVWVIAKDNGSLLSGHCTCVAGLGEACVHIAALAFKVELHNRLGLAMQTVTDKACIWRQTIKKVPAMPIADIDWSQPRKRLARMFQGTAATSERPEVTVSVDEQKLLHSMREAVPNAVLWQMTGTPVRMSSSTESCASDPDMELQSYIMKMLYNQKYCDLNAGELHAQCVRVMDSLQIEEHDVLTVEEHTRMQSKSSFWQAVRAGRITASVFGKFKPGSPLSISPTELFSICNPRASSFSSPAIEWGQNSEEMARNVFYFLQRGLHRNLKLFRCGFFISRSKPYLGASPDGVVSCDCHGKSLLEIKSPYSLRNCNPTEAPYIVTVRKVEHLDRNSEYFAQIQGQMAVCGLLKTFFVVWTTRGVFIEHIFFDKYYWDGLAKRLEEVFLHFLLPLLLTGQSEIPHEHRVNRSSPLCLCEVVKPGRIIRCDNERCSVAFYHYVCVNITRKPSKWLCNACSLAPQLHI